MLSSDIQILKIYIEILKYPVLNIPQVLGGPNCRGEYTFLRKCIYYIIVLYETSMIDARLPTNRCQTTGWVTAPTQNPMSPHGMVN